MDGSAVTPVGPLLWETIADELVALIADYLEPSTHGNEWSSRLERPLKGLKGHYAVDSIGAAHWVQLSRALWSSSTTWRRRLTLNHRAHVETMACCRVLEARDEATYDWPLQVLRLRASSIQLSRTTERHPLCPATPIPQNTLRVAYWAVAKEVHPDRLQVGALATAAMAVLNEAYRQAQLHFSKRHAVDLEVIRLDALGLEH